MTLRRYLPTPALVLLGALAAPTVQAQTATSAPEDPVQQANDLADTRRTLEAETAENPLAITTYRRNYIMPWTYNTNPDYSDFEEISTDGDVDKTEIKFQLSFKVKLLDDIFNSSGDLFFAYTQRSWWQAYNSEASAPFRETNYEPEAFISFDNRATLFGWTNTINRLGFAHQSNGRSDPLSRSWNRFYAEAIFERGDWAVSVMPHWRVPEKDDNDDNPDLENYIGYGDITVVKAIGEQELSLMVRGNPGKNNYGGQIDYSFPLFGKVRGYVQYYRGYGESLIDYSNDVQRIGLGFSINTFLAGIPGTR
ncbi:phospholipase A [Salinicola aestuarinus]|uniref:phospholipase A n=1 Tax=Salinicola aestuarinus TaxID=1949082 RepID=UPI000DA12000|nr:phospholipase A [Salinicola aestuarinus]